MKCCASGFHALPSARVSILLAVYDHEITPLRRVTSLSLSLSLSRSASTAILVVTRLNANRFCPSRQCDDWNQSCASPPPAN